MTEVGRRRSHAAWAWRPTRVPILKCHETCNESVKPTCPTLTLRKNLRRWQIVLTSEPGRGRSGRVVGQRVTFFLQEDSHETRIDMGGVAWGAGVLVSCAGAAAPAAFGQGVLVWINPPHPMPLPRPIPRPRPTPPPMSYKIKELDYHAKIVDQVAQVQVTQSFVNTGSRQMEVSFVFPLPYDGAIDRMTFMVDGKEYDAKLLPPRRARRIYEGYVRRNQDPALLEWVGYGMFQTSVFPGPAGGRAQGHAQVQPAPAEGPAAHRPDHSAFDRQVHVGAGREAVDQRRDRNGRRAEERL